MDELKNAETDSGKDRPIEELMEGVDFVYFSPYAGCKEPYKVDPKEVDPVYEDIFRKAWLEAEAELPSWECPQFDVPDFQKKILKERYGISIRTVYELNPSLKRFC